MAYPDGCKYTKDHEWIELTGDRGKVGITDYAQQQLGDVVYVELPEVGRDAEGGAVVRHHRIGEGRVRALRAGGRRSRRGERRLKDKPEAVNADPHGSWMIVVQLDRSRRSRRRCSTPRSTRSS